VKMALSFGGMWLFLNPTGHSRPGHGCRRGPKTPALLMPKFPTAQVFIYWGGRRNEKRFTATRTR
jgi:hypothetical protein